MREQLQEQERRQAEFRQSLQQQRPAAASPKPVPPTPLPTIGVDVPPQVLQVCATTVPSLDLCDRRQIAENQIAQCNEINFKMKYMYYIVCNEQSIYLQSIYNIVI